MGKCVAACFDVYYEPTRAKACCVVFAVRGAPATAAGPLSAFCPTSGPSERIMSEYCRLVTPINEYVPGQFYKRELPCILSVHEKVKEDISVAIVDGFVALGEGKKGLGAHLFEALGGKTAVIGVAKTFFKGCIEYATVYRGGSRRPLYVSSIGVDLDYSANLVQSLGGSHRIPAVLKRVDQLSRRGAQHGKRLPQRDGEPLFLI